MVCGGSLTENQRNRKKFKALFWRVDMSTCLKNFYNTSFFLLDSVQHSHFFFLKIFYSSASVIYICTCHTTLHAQWSNAVSKDRLRHKHAYAECLQRFSRKAMR